MRTLPTGSFDTNVGRRVRNCCYFYSLHNTYPYLHSFPTRRSSDLLLRVHANHRRDLLQQRGQLDRGRIQIEMAGRSEEHTSELQSLTNIVCRLLLEKKKTVFISMRCTLCGHFLQVALTLMLVVGYAIAAIFIACTIPTLIYTLSLHDALPIFFCASTRTIAAISSSSAGSWTVVGFKSRWP